MPPSGLITLRRPFLIEINRLGMELHVETTKVTPDPGVVRFLRKNRRNLIAEMREIEAENGYRAGE